jgi:DNA-binding GntR family transcriptional regulator
MNVSAPRRPGLAAPQATTLATLIAPHDGDLRGEAVYRAIKAAIVEGVLPEGARVQDRLLADALGVSRTPVREALQRLQAEGFVRSAPRVGLVVAEITPQDVEDIYVIRIALEGVAARLAAQRASADEVAMLRQINEQIVVSTQRRDVPTLTALNRQFHDAIYRATRNPRLADLLTTLHDSVQRFKRSTLSNPQRADEAAEEHWQILDAIRERDADRAEQLARQHKERAKQVRLAALSAPQQ